MEIISYYNARNDIASVATKNIFDSIKRTMILNLDRNASRWIIIVFSVMVYLVDNDDDANVGYEERTDAENDEDAKDVFDTKIGSFEHDFDPFLNEVVSNVQSTNCASTMNVFYFFAFFWLAPRGGVIGRPELSPPYGNFFLSAGWNQYEVVLLEVQLLFMNLNQINSRQLLLI